MLDGSFFLWYANPTPISIAFAAISGVANGPISNVLRSLGYGFTLVSIKAGNTTDIKFNNTIASVKRNTMYEVILT